MPYQITKLPSGKFRVKNKETGAVKSKGTTLVKAKSQVRLLEAFDMLSSNKKK